MAKKVGRPKGSGKGVGLSVEHRRKIQNSNILTYLMQHALGEREMSSTQVQVGLGLVKKYLPDLQTTDGEVEHKHSGEVTIIATGVPRADD